MHAPVVVRSGRVIGLLVVLCCKSVLSWGCASSPTARPAGHEDVVAVVNRLFEGMESKDEGVLRTVLDDDVAMVAIDERAGTITAAGTKDSFVNAILNAPATVREEMWAPEVRIDGNLATLWAPYELWLDDRFSHCGVDSFQFVRREGGWRIVGVAYTRRRDGCDPGDGPGLQ